MIGLDAGAVVDLQRRSLRTEAVAELIDVRGRRGRLADDRELDPLSAQAGRLQRSDPVRVQDLVREQPLGGGQHAWLRRGEARRPNRAGTCRRSPVVGPRGRVRHHPPPRRVCVSRRRGVVHDQPHAGDHVDIPLHALRQLRSVHRQRHQLIPRRGVVDGPLRAEHLLRLADRHRRPRAQMGHVDLGRHALGLEGVLDSVPHRRRGTPLALQRRERRIFPIGIRLRVARLLRGAVHAGDVGLETYLQRQLAAGRGRARLLEPLMGNGAVVHPRLSRVCARGKAERPR